MREDPVNFYSQGSRLSGLIRRPDGEGPWPAVAQGPGWLGLKDAKLYEPYHRALTAAGFAVLIFDYRGFGDSEPAPGGLSLHHQIDDWVNAVAYLESRDDVFADRIGLFGSGGTGGGNAILAAARLTQIRSTVIQVPVSDGEDWLRRMRRGYEWQEFLARLAADRTKRVTTDAGEWVNPREEILVPTPERRKTAIKSDVDGRVPDSVPLALAEEIIAYKPIDVVAQVGHLLVIAVEDDAVTPTDHAVALYRAASTPKRMILQRQTSHYAAYEQYGDIVIPEIVAWFAAHLTGRAVEAETPDGTESLREVP
jgi:hypothetical protein